MGQSKITSSLLPAAIRRQKIWQEKTKWFAAAAALFVVGALGAGASWYLNDYAYGQAQATRDDYQAKIRQANNLSGIWRNEVENVGKKDIDELLRVNALQQYRELWPTLVNEVLGVVPTADLNTLKSIKREDRKQIVIDSIQSKYLPDLRVALTAQGTDFTKLMGREGADAAFAPRGRIVDAGSEDPGGIAVEQDVQATGALAANTQRGFILTIRGTTPNKDRRGYIDSAFVQQLLKKTAETQLKLGRDWYIARAEIAESGARKPIGKEQGQFAPIGEDGEDAGLIEGEIIILDKNGKEIFDPKRDRFFPDETILKDTQFVVMAVVVLDPATAVANDPNKPKPPQ